MDNRFNAVEFTNAVIWSAAWMLPVLWLFGVFG